MVASRRLWKLLNEFCVIWLCPNLCLSTNLCSPPAATIDPVPLALMLPLLLRQHPPGNRLQLTDFSFYVRENSNFKIIIRKLSTRIFICVVLFSIISYKLIYCIAFNGLSKCLFHIQQNCIIIWPTSWICLLKVNRKECCRYGKKFSCRQISKLYTVYMLQCISNCMTN